MDFFASQDAARVRTRWLVFLFLVAVVLIILSVYAVVSPILIYQGLGGESEASETSALLRFFDLERFLLVALGTITLISLGSLYKLAALRDGGEAVARMLGGRPVLPSTLDREERKLLNVVEEMALASGTPVPRVFLMEQEQGINAFAAGYSTENAVIGVTRGCIHHLNRDELQGVIAHEFSHILNGDMRLNLKLIGILHGILLIAIIGRILLRTGYVRSSSRQKGGNPLPFIGLALLIIGYIGLFFGQLIKAAVSRQREFLADASAVQFTRNPGGIAGALKKIGGLSAGSKMESAHAEEASHMFFGESKRPWLAFILASHPPLEERIRRIDPYFAQSLQQGGAPSSTGSSLAGELGVSALASSSALPGSSGHAAALTTQAATDRVGTLDLAHVQYVRSLLETIPQGVRESVQDPTGAEGLVYALLIHPNSQVRTVQVELLQKAVPVEVLRMTKLHWTSIQDLPPETRLPLLDLALPALRVLSEEQFRSFYETVRALITADNALGLFEYVVQTTLSRHMQAVHGEKASHAARQSLQLSQCREQCAVLLSVLSHAGHAEVGDIQSAFAAACEELGTVGKKLSLVPEADSRLRDLDKALDRLAQLRGEAKRSLLQAATACILHDQTVSIAEGELLRAVSEALRCPMPPFIPGMEI